MLRMMNRLVAPALLLALAAGCDEDKRLIEQTREADQRQAEQNRQIAHQNQQLAEATNKLIEADARSREELVALERDLQAERAAIGKQRDELEAERRQIAGQRLQESLLVQCLDGALTVLSSLLPLVLCWYLLSGWRSSSSDEALGELLTFELAGGSPSRLSPVPVKAAAEEACLPCHQPADYGSTDELPPIA